MTLTSLELRKRLTTEKDFRLIDVREPDEWAVARLPEAELLPLSQFQERALQELSPDEKIVLYCHHGVRSGRALDFLKANGYKDVLHLAGGIDAWSTEVDPTVPRY